jgi:exodeoxyribonuclease VII small subunit
MSSERGAKIAAFDEWQRVLETGEFEACLSALEAAVQLLDGGSLSLEQSVRCYELGSRLSRRCDSILNEAQLRISRVDDEVDSDAATEDGRLL